ncbi:MAG: hypothetical protein OEV64_08320 [Desulfobulbaceae bacterium]|nr:hypothetical protein [Desulfobulbaceae bacterium]
MTKESKRAVYHIHPLRPIIKLVESHGGEDDKLGDLTSRSADDKILTQYVECLLLPTSIYCDISLPKVIIQAIIIQE